jgi:hypothetical protein
MRNVILAFLSALSINAAVSAQSQVFTFSGDLDATGLDASIFGLSLSENGGSNLFEGAVLARLVYDTSASPLFEFNQPDGLPINIAAYQYDSFDVTIGNRFFSSTESRPSIAITNLIGITDGFASPALCSGDGILPTGCRDSVGVTATDIPFGDSQTVSISVNAGTIVNTILGSTSGNGLSSYNELFENQIFNPGFAFNHGGSFSVINDSGGFASHNSFRNVRLTSITSAIPEPATWLMMIFGFGIMGLALRRRVRMEIVL